MTQGKEKDKTMQKTRQGRRQDKAQHKTKRNIEDEPWECASTSGGSSALCCCVGDARVRVRVTEEDKKNKDKCS
jgi:hypothetical protein